MKTLLLLRHGKAESYCTEDDRSRVLADRGVRDSERMGAQLLDLGVKLDIVLSSNAARAAQTARLAAGSAGFEGTLLYNPEIYGASVQTLLRVIRTLPEHADTALLIGHNPGFEEVIADITDEPPMRVSLPTCGLARIALAGKWAETSSGSGLLQGIWSPKNL